MTTPLFDPCQGDTVLSRTGRFVGYVMNVDKDTVAVAGRGRVVRIPRDFVRTRLDTAWLVDCEPESLETRSSVDVPP